MIYKLILKVLKMKYKEQTGLLTDSIQLRHKRTNARIFYLNERISPGKKLSINFERKATRVQVQFSGFNLKQLKYMFVANSLFAAGWRIFTVF